MVGYYDAVLSGIPVVYILSMAITAVFGYPITFGVVAASTACILIVGHALFINTPVSPDTQDPPTDSTINTASSDD